MAPEQVDGEPDRRAQAADLDRAEVREWLTRLIGASARRTMRFEELAARE